MEQNEVLSSLVTIIIAAIVRYFEKRSIKKQYKKDDEQTLA